MQGRREYFFSFENIMSRYGAVSTATSPTMNINTNMHVYTNFTINIREAHKDKIGLAELDLVDWDFASKAVDEGQLSP